MQTAEEILQKWDARGARFYQRMEITGDGLVLGAGTILAKSARDMRGAARVALDDEPRVLALLATAYERPNKPYLLAKIHRACELWNEGEKALAHIHLAQAGFPPCDEVRALRLFAADKPLVSGVTLDALMKAQGFDPAPLAFLKYNPDQPRVPAGNGRESGQWTSDGGGGSEGSDAAGSEDDATSENVVEGRSSSSISVASPTPGPSASEPPTSGQQLSFAGTLIDKRYDEVLNITHCWYSTPLGQFAIEIHGFSVCPETYPAPW